MIVRVSDRAQDDDLGARGDELRASRGGSRGAKKVSPGNLPRPRRKVEPMTEGFHAASSLRESSLMTLFALQNLQRSTFGFVLVVVVKVDLISALVLMVRVFFDN